MNDCAPIYLSCQFKTRDEASCRDTRNGNELDVPLFKTATGQLTFYYRTVPLWNNIHPDLRLWDSIQNFKMKLKRNLLQQFQDNYKHDNCMFLLSVCCRPIKLFDHNETTVFTYGYMKYFLIN